MIKVTSLIILALFAVTASAKPTTEDELISELKRILLDGDADTDVDATGQLDTDEEERAKEEQITKGLEEATGKEKGDETVEIQGGGLGELSPDVEGELENNEQVGEQNPEKGPAVQGLLQEGWDMLDDLQRVSVALYMEKHPISDNRGPREALHDALVRMFEFDGLANQVVNNLFRRLSPSTDMCSEMFPEQEEKTLERVTNCFIMTFTQLLSLVEHLEKASSISEVKSEDIIRLSTLERDLQRVSYEVFKILKREDPSVSLPGIVGDKEAAIAAMQEGDVTITESKPGASPAQAGKSGEEEGAGTGQDNDGEEEEEEEEEEDDAPAVRSSMGLSKKDFISRLAKKLQNLVGSRNYR